MGSRIASIFSKALDLGRAHRVAAALGLAAFLVAALPGGYFGYEAYRFAWTDPRFCFTCHIHDYANIEWKKSVHGDTTTCHDCHHIPLLHYTYIGAKALLDAPEYPNDLKHPPSIPDDLCIKCHVRSVIKRENWTLPLQFDKLKKIPAIDFTAGHRWHTASETTKPEPAVLLDKTAKEAVQEGFQPRHILNCWRCHGAEHNRAHQYKATNYNCRSCHADSHLAEQLKFVGADCLLCHINAFVLDYRNPASKALKPEEVKGIEGTSLDDLLKELKMKYPIEEMVLQ